HLWRMAAPARRPRRRPMVWRRRLRRIPGRWIFRWWFLRRWRRLLRRWRLVRRRRRVGRMVTMRASLSVAERERIHAATAAVERQTSALFALTIVPVSERYLLFPLVWGAVLALAATGVLALIRPDLGV